MDLIIHGSPTLVQISSIEQQIKNAGIVFERIDLRKNELVNTLGYLQQQPLLNSIVAPTNDEFVARMVDEYLPQSGERMNVPIVLIGDEIKAEIRRQSVA